jgi:hypothetical protein
LKNYKKFAVKSAPEDLAKGQDNNISQIYISPIMTSRIKNSSTPARIDVIHSIITGCNTFKPKFSWDCASCKCIHAKPAPCICAKSPLINSFKANQCRKNPCSRLFSNKASPQFACQVSKHGPPFVIMIKLHISCSLPKYFQPRHVFGSSSSESNST